MDRFINGHIILTAANASPKAIRNPDTAMTSAKAVTSGQCLQLTDSVILRITLLCGQQSRFYSIKQLQYANEIPGGRSAFLLGALQANDFEGPVVSKFYKRHILSIDASTDIDKKTANTGV